MRKFGWILSSIILLIMCTASVFAGECDIIEGSAYKDPWVIPAGTNCTFSNTVLETDTGASGSTSSIIIEGSLVLNNVTLRMPSGTESSINVTGNFETDNGSYIISNNCDPFCYSKNISFFFDGDVNLKKTEIRPVGEMYSENELTLSEVSIYLAQTALNASGNVTVNDTFFDCVGSNCVIIDDATKVSFSNFSIRSPNLPFTITRSGDVTFSDFQISSFGSIDNASYVIDSDVTFESGTFSKVDLYVYDSNASFIDVDASKVRDDPGSIISQYWSVLFRIARENGLAIPLAFVEAAHQYGFFTSLYSDLSGEAYVPLLSSVENDTAIRYYSNYSINITHSKYQGVTYTINATEPYVVDVNLSTAKGLVKMGDNCLTTSSLFCAAQNPAPTCFDMRAREKCYVSFVVNATDNSENAVNGLINKSFDFFTIVGSSIPLVEVKESDIVTITVVE